MKQKLNRFWSFLSSMKFGMLLMGILCVACVFGSVVPQGKSLEWYLEQYSQRRAALLYGLHLSDVFRSAWFLILTAVLCCNLVLCTLLRLPGVLRRWRAAADPEAAAKARPVVTLTGVTEPEALFARLHMGKPRALTAEGKQVRFAARNRIGIWGAAVCHLGILLLVLGYVLGQTTKLEYTVYGVPGQTRPVGDTGYALTIEDFRVGLQESGTPEQFTSRVTMRNASGSQVETAEVSVNHPGSLLGFSAYQNSMGNAAKLTVLVHGEPSQEAVLCQGEYLQITGTPVAVFFDGYDAQAPFDDGSVRAVYDYTIYDSTEGRSSSGYQLEGEAAMTTSVYELRFSEPQHYTLLQLKKDRFLWLAMLGALTVLAGLILAFYLQPKQLRAQEEADGTWTVCGFSRKGGALFADQVKKQAAEGCAGAEGGTE